MKKILFIIMLMITCISFGKNNYGNTDITTEAKGMLRFVWSRNGKYNKDTVLPITGEDGTGGFAIYLEFTPEDKEKFMNNVLIVWPGNTDGRISGREMYNRILNIGKEISPVSVTSPFEYGELLTKEINATINKAKQNEVIFSMKDLKKPFLTANNIMVEYLEPQLKQKLAEMESETFETFASRVQKKLFQLIPSGQFGLENVAEEFGISGRTLQRNLSAENTSFNQLVKDIQKIMTFNYLEAKELSIDEIAYLVGYTETSSFYRAFKKWTGKTVSQYQKKKE